MIYESQINRFKESFLLAAARGGRIDEVASLVELGKSSNLLTYSSFPFQKGIITDIISFQALM